jgi:predicted transcriptional regulator
MKHKISGEKWESVMDLFAKIFREPSRLDSLPDKAVLLSLSDEEITKIFTKERLRLIKTINQKHPKTLSELSAIVKRNLVAVERDLKILEDFGIVKLEKKGKEVMPTIEKKALILPLQTKPLTIEQIEEQRIVA